MTATPPDDKRFRDRQLRSCFLIGCAALAILFLAAFLVLSVIGLAI